MSALPARIGRYEIEAEVGRGTMGVVYRARAGRPVFAGKRATDELPAFLGVASVVVSPRVSGVNTPFKIYTYLASGRPLVATRTLTHTQLLDDTTAWLVDATPAGIAGGIRAALADPAEAGLRAERGRALVEREYSAARYAEKVAAAYSAIGARR